jgi:HD-GYP domain-containing protein (c-di-GMP phosphodiesterase class II)
MSSRKFVNVENLKQGMILDQPILDSRGRTMIEKGIFLGTYQIKYLQEKGFRGVYIYDPRENKDARPKKVLEEIRRYRVPDRPVVTISDNTRRELKSSIQTIFDDPSSDFFSEYTNKITDNIEKSIMDNDAVAVDISTIRASDQYTFRHSVDVGVLSLMIEHQYGLTGDALHQLGIAGLLHDVGKARIPLSILNKPGKLTKEEFDIIKRHPVYGFEIVRDHHAYSPQILEGILHHHEKMNGTGYPDGQRYGEISDFARIISIADIFDALVTKRPYKNPCTGREAIEMIYAMGNELDNRLINAFLESVILYPVDSIVKLSNGRAAQVVENYSKYPSRPKCVDVLNGSIIDLCKDEHCMNLVIAS